MLAARSRTPGVCHAMRRAEASPTNAEETNEKNPLVKKRTGQLYLFFSSSFLSIGGWGVGGVDKLRVSRAFWVVGLGVGWDGMGGEGCGGVCGGCAGVSLWAHCTVRSSGGGGGGGVR